MRNLFTLFNRKPTTAPLAEAVTRWEREAFARPGPVAGELPPATLDQMRRDAMVQTVLSVKTLGVLAAPGRIEPGDGSPRAAEAARFAEAALARMEGSAEGVLRQALDAFAAGWSVQELTYAEDGGRLWLRECRPVDVRYLGLRLDSYGRIEGLTLEVPGEAARDLPRERYVIHRHRAGFGRPKGTSDLEAAYRHWKAKGDLLGRWELHLGKFASPTVVGRFGPGVTGAEQTRLLDALRNLSSAGALVVPQEVEVAPLPVEREGSAYAEAVEWHNREIARAVLGQTLTTDEGRRVGSLALGRVHLRVFELQLRAIRRELADVVLTEQVLRPLVALNFGPGWPVPRYRFEEAPGLDELQESA